MVALPAEHAQPVQLSLMRGLKDHPLKMSQAYFLPSLFE